MNYEILEREILSEGIEIVNMNFRGNLKGLYADNTIAIDRKIITNAEKCCVLAEELGHHFTSIGDILDSKDLINIKQEKQARNWAYEKLVSITGIIDAFNAGTKNKYEMAEYLDVTEEFLEKSIIHYKEKHGIFLEIDEYIIYFEPYFGVMKKYNIK